MNIKNFWKLIILPIFLLFSCGSPAPTGTSQTQPTPLLTPFVDSTRIPNEEETATLRSLEQVDDYPLYTMRYIGSYSGRARFHEPTYLPKTTILPAQTSCRVNWGCSLFAALGDEENRLFGRNFDWRFSPALLLFTDPPDGYASVSMVDIEYLGFEGDRSKNLTDLPLT